MVRYESSNQLQASESTFLISVLVTSQVLSFSLSKNKAGPDQERESTNLYPHAYLTIQILVAFVLLLCTPSLLWNYGIHVMTYPICSHLSCSCTCTTVWQQMHLQTALLYSPPSACTALKFGDALRWYSKILPVILKQPCYANCFFHLPIRWGPWRLLRYTGFTLPYLSVSRHLMHSPILHSEVTHASQ